MRSYKTSLDLAEACLLRSADRIEQLEAKLALAIAALKQSRDELDMYSWHEYPGDHPVQARYRQRDYEANPARIALVELGIAE